MEKTRYDFDIRRILNEIRICTWLQCTDNGKIYSLSAEEYLAWIGQFKKYCIPEMASEWETTIRKIVYSTVVLKAQFKDDPRAQEIIDDDDCSIINSLHHFMDAGEIMQIYDETHSWEEVYELLQDQMHTESTFSGLSGVMIQYSLIGVDFIDRFASDRVVRDKEFRKSYNKSKKYINSRQELNKRLIRALSPKCS